MKPQRRKRSSDVIVFAAVLTMVLGLIAYVAGLR